VTDKNWTGDFKPRKGNTTHHPARSDMTIGSVVLPAGKPGTAGPRLASIEARLKAAEDEIQRLRARVVTLEEELDD
jgi:hypothetical protein